MRARVAKAGGIRPGALDPDDVRAARGFLLRTALFVAYAAAPALLGAGSMADTGARLLVAFTMGGSFAIVVAVLRGERAGRGKLNRWDEAIAFNGLAMLVHLGLGMVPHG